MRELFIVKVDSFSDVITNSSTDIFACKSKKSVQAIEELLSGIATAAGETASLTVEEQTIGEFWDKTKDFCILGMGYDYVFDKDDNQKGWTFGNEFDKDDNQKGWTFGNEYKFPYKELENKWRAFDEIPNKTDVEMMIPEDKLFDQWLSRHASYFGKDVTKETKIIVICGIEDNSIPYWIQEYIQSQMHAVRYHLG